LNLTQEQIVDEINFQKALTGKTSKTLLLHVQLMCAQNDSGKTLLYLF